MALQPRMGRGAGPGPHRHQVGIAGLGAAQQEVVGIHLIGQLGDDECLAAAGVLLNGDDRAHGDRAAAGALGVLDALAADDERAGREVRALHPLHERGEALLALGVRMLEQPQCAVGDLAQVVRGDVRRHADRDARAAVDEQVREAAGQDERLLGAAVVVRAEVDGLLVDVAHHLHGERGHPALGVALGGRRVVARGAEVALPLHERVAQRPRLGQAHEGVVDGTVAMRVVVAHDVADDAGALGEVAVGAVAAVVHRVEHAAVHRLESVTHVREGA